MTQIDFHVGSPDKSTYAARLARKAYASGAWLVVTAPDDVLARFDQKLWTFAQLEFVPHVLASSPLAWQTPVVLASDLSKVPESHKVLLNLGVAVPEGFARFDRLLDLVGQDEQDRVHGRERFRHYRQRGYPMRTHEVREP